MNDIMMYILGTSTELNAENVLRIFLFLLLFEGIAGLIKEFVRGVR